MEEERVWGFDENSEWSQFTNLDAELPVNKPVEVVEKKPLGKPKSVTEKPCFFFPKTKTEVKGGVISTPQGYGIIQDIKSDGKILSIKVNNVIQDYKRTEVSYEIPLHITFCSNSTKFEATSHFPIYMSVTELLAKIDEMEIEGGTTGTKRVFYNGKELGQDITTIEKYGIMPDGKLLVIFTLGKFSIVNRYASITSGWGYSQGSTDAISFTASKNIKLVGFGVYVPNNANKMTGEIKLVQGENVKGTPSATKQIEMTQNGPDVVEKVYRARFDKPVVIKAGEKYTCVTVMNSGNSHYGSGGKVSVTENGVTFTFIHCNGSANGTGTGSGQIPELYFYA
mmetsp:Transcript_72982/g.84679  ORF Transcript_72982/g.84679 Transcript_72982/m.84679 type:complete len:339 (+) Transcript_72982:30-1046(+)